QISRTVNTLRLLRSVAASGETCFPLIQSQIPHLIVPLFQYLPVNVQMTEHQKKENGFDILITAADVFRALAQVCGQFD
ncbi:MAG: hypothetical protein EZS28_050833, partial [Streblomastix strix]